MLRSATVVVLLLGFVLMLGLATDSSGLRSVHFQDPAGVLQTPKAAATPPSDEIGPDDVIRIETNLVTVPVRVRDQKGRYIADMQAEEFQIFEEGVEQQVAFFAPVESPFTVILMLDISDSTESSLKDIKQAAFSFISQLRADDSVIIIVFDSRLNVLAQPTSDREELRRLLEGINPGGGTRLYDALDLIARRLLPQIKERKSIVLFTDGVDIDSRATADESLRKMEESDAIIYCVHYDTYAAIAEKMRKANSSSPVSIVSDKGTRREDYALARRYLNRLADRNGGHRYEARNPKKLATAFSLIAEELRWQYSVGYYPSARGEAGTRRRINVRVTRPRVDVNARESYVYQPRP